MNSKKIVSIMLAVVLCASIFVYTGIVFADQDINNGLGAVESCNHHNLTYFAGVPACVNENGDLHICENNFPDENFREYVINETISHSNADYITKREAEEVTQLLFNCNSVGDFGYLGETPVKSVKGLEFFTQLSQLRCEGHEIEEIHLSNNKQLTLLMIPNNRLKELDLTANTELKNLSCGKNELESLEVYNLKLNTVAFSDNHIAQVNDFINTDIKAWGANGEYEDEKGYYTESQTINLEAIPTADGKWTVDLSDKVDKENFERIKMMTDGVEYDANTGIITLDKWSDSIIYDYSYKARALNNGEVEWLKGNMAVTVNLTQGSSTDPTETTTDTTEKPTAPTTETTTQTTTDKTEETTQSTTVTTADSNDLGSNTGTTISDNGNVGKDGSTKSPNTGNSEKFATIIPITIILTSVSVFAIALYSKKKVTK